MGGPGGPSRPESVRHFPATPKSVRRAARLPPEADAWYLGLGNGNFSAGLRRAYEIAHRVHAPADARRDTFDVNAATSTLLPHWSARARQRLGDQADLGWIRGRLARFPHFTPARARDVLTNLRRLA